MNATPELERRKALKEWMKAAQVTCIWASRQLHVTPSTVQKWLFCAATIRPWHRENLIALGFPAELLPPGEFRKTGPQPKVPVFVQQQ